MAHLACTHPPLSGSPDVAWPSSSCVSFVRLLGGSGRRPASFSADLGLGVFGILGCIGSCSEGSALVGCCHDRRVFIIMEFLWSPARSSFSLRLMRAVKKPPDSGMASRCLPSSTNTWLMWKAPICPHLGSGLSKGCVHSARASTCLCRKARHHLSGAMARGLEEQLSPPKCLRCASAFSRSTSPKNVLKAYRLHTLQLLRRWQLPCLFVFVIQFCLELVQEHAQRAANGTP